MAPDEYDELTGPAMTRHALLVKAIITGGAASMLGARPALGALDRTVGVRGAEKATPTRGGTLLLAAAPSLRGFDPQKFWDGFVWSGTLAISDSLLWVGDDLKLHPNLVSLPKITRGGTLYTFKLRRGVRFHHGREMTADDVKFSLERIVTPEFACEGSSLYTGIPIVGLADVVNQKAKTISGIKAVDRYTVSIAMEKPDSALPFLLSLPFASVVPRDVVQQLGDAKFNLAPVGTGAFTMSNVDLAKGFTLKRFPKYWNPARPYLDGVQATVGIDPSLAALKIERGELDMMQQRPPLDLVVQLRDSFDKSAQLVLKAYNLWYYFTLNVQQYEPLKDVRVRRAIAMSLDRKRLVRSLRGLAAVAPGGLFSPQTPYYQKSIQIPFNPAAAKGLLRDAGYANGFDIEVLGGSGSPDKEMVQNAAFDLQQVGLRPTVTLTKGGQFGARAYHGNPPPMTAYVWDLPYPHGSYFIDGAFTSAAVAAQCCDLSMYATSRVDRLAQQAHTEQDPAKIAKIYKEIDKIVVHDEVAAIPMIQDIRIELMSKRVRGFKVPKTFTTPHFFKDYWLKK